MNEPLDVAWHDDGVCTATLNRPAAGNALSAGLVDALVAAVDACTTRGTALLVLRGAGRHFCTGFDLAALDAESDDRLLARFVRIELMLQRVHRAPFPTLAIAHGRTVGAGADLFAACRHRWALPGTQFAFPGASGFGLVLGTRRLVQRVGAARAARWVERGETIALDEALATGLAHGTVDDAAIADRVGRLSQQATDGGNRTPELDSALQAADPVHDALDLSLLVRSAAAPGLKDRITAYVARQQARRTSNSVTS